MLIEQHRIAAATQLVLRLLEPSDPGLDVAAGMTVGLQLAMEPGEREQMVAALVARARKHAADGTAEQGASLAYNAAQIMLSADAQATVDLYKEAAELDSAYRERP